MVTTKTRDNGRNHRGGRRHDPAQEIAARKAAVALGAQPVSIAPAGAQGARAQGVAMELPRGISHATDVVIIPLDHILAMGGGWFDEANPKITQPREHFDDDDLADLAASLKQDGQLQPIGVRPVPPRRNDRDVEYEIVFGERRWRAAQAAGLTTIKAVVLDKDAQDAYRLALVENINRQDLSPVEIGKALVRLKTFLQEDRNRYYEGVHKGGKAVRAPKVTWDDVADEVKLSRRQVMYLKDLSGLADDVQEDVNEGRLSGHQARAVARFKTPEKQRRFRTEIINKGWGGEEAEKQATLRLRRASSTEIADSTNNHADEDAAPQDSGPAIVGDVRRAISFMAAAAHALEGGAVVGIESRNELKELARLGRSHLERIERAAAGANRAGAKQREAVAA